MRRDLELIRDILITIADSEGDIDAAVFVTDTDSIAHVIHQVKVLEQAGFIEAYLPVYKSGQLAATIKDITWAGEEFLASIQDDTIWSRTKKEIGKQLPAVTFDIIKAVALKLISGLLLV